MSSTGGGPTASCNSRMYDGWFKTPQAAREDGLVYNPAPA